MLLRMLLFMAVVVGGCRSDRPPPALHTSAAPASEAEGIDASDPAQAAETPDRDLWFRDGPGRAAILARERQDYERAVVLLDALLAREDLSENDRGAAQWLRGLEDLRLQHYAAAADRFAQARTAPALGPVQLRLQTLEAQARLDASDPTQALELVEAVDSGERRRSSLDDDLLVIEADARARTHDHAGAEAAYRRYLERYPRGARRYEVSAKLARLLAASDDDKQAAEALALYERLLLESPLSDYGEEAREAVDALTKRVGTRRKGQEARAFTIDLALAELNALVDRRNYAQAVSAADRLIRMAGIEAATRCQTLFAKGTAIFKQRKRQAARPVFEQASRVCAGADERTHEVKSRYQAARGRYAEGAYEKAAVAFESLARDHADHNYADDAWVLAAESWSEHGEADKAKAALRQALAVPDGDMREEALRRLLVHALSGGEFAAAVTLCDEALAKNGLAHTMRAKLHYFRGRALRDQGQLEQAVAAWQEALTEDPLGYPALQALSRLRDTSAEALAQGLSRLESDGVSEQAVALESAGPGTQRAVILARLGLGQEASEELAQEGVDGWPAVAVLNQAGLYAEAQRLLGSIGGRWRAQAPGNGGVHRWTLAHPRPFAAVVSPKERAHVVPDLLTYAVMQTESLFDPGVTSWAGARGLVQLMPSTASGLANEAGIVLGHESLFDPDINLELGTRYLGQLVRRYGGGTGAVVLAVPSYNAGAGAVDRWLAERGDWDLDLFVESIPYDETRAYTQRVLGRWFTYRWIYGEGDPADRVPFLPRGTPGKATP